MKLSCLVNHYNYRHFVTEAVDSALAQTVPFDEIIVVDDGSTDGGAELLRERYAGSHVVRLIAKRNEGQLSCFNAGFAAASGDIAFFLDADDVYEPRYVEEALAVYTRNPGIDFVFCGHRKFGRFERDETNPGGDVDCGYSVLGALFLRKWIGAPTSCLSVRRTVLEKVLPIPFLEDWNTRADDCIVFGTSVAGARKYYLAKPLVRYRTHGDNRFFGRGYDRDRDYRRKLALNRLLTLMAQRSGYDRRTLAELAHREFRTIPKPTWRDLRRYCRLPRVSGATFALRLGKITSMLSWFFQSRLTRRRPASVDLRAGSVSAALGRPDNRVTRPSSHLKTG